MKRHFGMFLPGYPPRIFIYQIKTNSITVGVFLQVYLGFYLKCPIICGWIQDTRSCDLLLCPGLMYSHAAAPGSSSLFA